MSLFYLTTANTVDRTNIILNIKDIVSCLFYIATGIIALLTYLGARKTVLQPINTEIFKKQLEQFTNIMELFNGKSEIELRKFFDFDGLLNCNIIKTLDNYAFIFFEIKFDREKRPYNSHNCPSGIISQKYAEKYLMIADDATISDRRNNRDPIDSNTKAIIWKEYIFGEISLTKKHLDTLQKINTIIASPLLPKECINYLSEIKEIVNKNVAQIGKLLTEVAQEIPEKYPNLDALKKVSTIWIENKYNSKFINLEDSCLKLTDYLRKYLGTDSLLFK